MEIPVPELEPEAESDSEPDPEPSPPATEEAEEELAIPLDEKDLLGDSGNGTPPENPAETAQQPKAAREKAAAKQPHKPTSATPDKTTAKPGGDDGSASAAADKLLQGYLRGRRF